MGNEVSLIKEGEKVGSSESTLLNMLNISPFTYGLLIEQVYDSGTIFSPAILDITDDDIIARFMQGVRNIAVMTDIDFEEANMTKEYLKDPSKFAAAAAPAASAAPAEAKKEEKKEESESEDDDMGFGLFD